MILALIEHDRGQLNATSLEMLTLARQLSDATSSSLEAVLIGAEAESIATDLGAYGVSTVHLAVHDQLTDYAPAAWAQSLSEHLASAQVIMAAGTDRGNEVMAHVAARHDLAMAANCVSVQVGDSFTVQRARWGGTLLEEATISDEVKLLTVAPLAVEAQPADTPVTANITTFTPTLDDQALSVRITSRVETPKDKVSLTDADVIVSGGRGMGSAEAFGILEELAELLGGAVGASRVATNQGWRSHADQVGQTGTRVAPELYIACGISGATQHLVGCRGSKHILVINKDREAPIMAKASYAIIGDLHEVIPAITAEVQKAKAEAAVV